MKKIFFRERYGISQNNLNVFMKTRWEGQLKRSQKVQLYHMLLDHRF